MQSVIFIICISLIVLLCFARFVRVLCVKFYYTGSLPASIIILTDGYAPFPQEKLSMNIPVLWLINNNDVDPPWGKVARITV